MHATHISAYFPRYVQHSNLYLRVICLLEQIQIEKNVLQNGGIALATHSLNQNKSIDLNCSLREAD